MEISVSFLAVLDIDFEDPLRRSIIPHPSEEDTFVEETRFVILVFV